MSSGASYTALAKNIGTQYNITEEEVRTQLNTYMNRILMPPMTENEILTMIEENPAVPEQQHRLPRFDEAQRAARRAASEKMRQCVIDYACLEGRLTRHYYSHNEDIGRSGQSLFYYEAPGEHDSRNREVLWMLDKNPNNRPGYIAEKKQQLMDAGKTEQEAQQEAEAFFDEESLRTRLGKLFVDRVRDALDVVSHLKEMASTELPPDQLAQNYITMCSARDLLMDLDLNIVEANKENGRLRLSAEDLNFLQQCKDNQILFYETLFPLTTMANPLYEYVDLDAVMDSNIQTMLSLHGRFLDGPQGTVYRQQCLEIDPNYNNYSSVAVDHFRAYLEDALMIQSQRSTQTDMREQARMADVYGFIPEFTTQVCESQWDFKMVNETRTPLGSEKPTAYEMGNRVVILTSNGTNSHPSVTAENPEAMFNFSLDTKIEQILALQDSTDVWYKRSSPEYKAMKAALLHACTVPPLKEGAKRDANELDAARGPFKALLAAAEAYLQTKPEQSAKTYENNRIQAAKQIKAHAEIKLRELDLIEKARLTLERHKDMDDDAIRTATTAENEAFGRLRRADARRQDPTRWLGDLCDMYTKKGLPISFCSPFSDAIDDLRPRRRDENGTFINHDDELRITTKLLLGYSVAGELILRERAQRDHDQLVGAGPIETAFTSSIKRRQNWCRALGDIVFEEFIGSNADSMSAEDLTHIITSFEPDVIADAVKDSFSAKCSAQLVNDVQQQCCKPVFDDRVIRQFIDDTIYAPLETFQNSALDNAPSIDFASAYSMMNSYVLINMAGCEGQTAERLRMLMKKPDNISELCKLIPTSQFFKDLVNKFDMGEKATDIARLSNIVHDRTIHNTALDILSEDQFSGIVNDMWNQQQLTAVSNSVNFFTNIMNQYSAPIFGQPPLITFVTNNIVNPANSYQTKMKAMDVSTDFAEGYRLLSSCMLASAVQLESLADGKLARLMSSPDNVESMLQLIQASESFKQMVDNFHTMGEHPDINEIPKLIESRQPQNAARQFLKTEFRQMIDKVAQQHKPAVQNGGPQVANVPQAGNGRP